ncbi:hypothetical protein LIER_26702 [Lithospermum erythrorhizon]|uniref:MULE transposase domain-containing protein n=1 Tax=Lithospermum erythrorhizon TaxID=34254 RepID=A0AAV3R9J2_LITER
MYVGLRPLIEGFKIEDQAWVFISDKQKGLESAIREKFSYYEHRTCMHHLCNNFKKDNKDGDLRDRLWACARASNPIWFKTRMKQFQNVDKKAHLWLFNHGNSSRRWCKVFFPLAVKSDMLCNNLSESFNSFTLEAKDKPIITMLETIKRKLMERKSDSICPRIVKILDDHFTLSDGMEIEWNGGTPLRSGYMITCIL